MNSENQQALLHRLRIVRGQVDGIISMVEDNRYCIDISTQLMAASAALMGINKSVLTAHLDSCVKGAMESKNTSEVDEKLGEIARVIEKLSR